MARLDEWAERGGIRWKEGSKEESREILNEGVVERG